MAFSTTNMLQFLNMEGHKNPTKSFFLLKKQNEPNFGFTTGTCAQAASVAATKMLPTQNAVPYVILTTPKGIKICIEIENQTIAEDSASCSVQKFSGADSDITNGIHLFATVRRSPRQKESKSTVNIHGGEGIGKVSLPGLDQKPGEWAINRVPRKMIAEGVESELRKHGKKLNLDVEISIPGGEKLAAKTFNPKLGITGGLSVLGTSGIVEPMSEQAILDTIQLEMNVRKSQKIRRLLMVPGNYGSEFLKKEFGISMDRAVHCSNFVYDSVQMAVKTGFKKMLFCGHIGKLIKVAGGIKNTHSKHGDRRMEILCEFTKQFVGKKDFPPLEEKLKSCISTEQAISVLDESTALRGKIMQKIAEKIREQMEAWSGQKIKAEVILFTNEHGLLAKA